MKPLIASLFCAAMLAAALPVQAQGPTQSKNKASAPVQGAAQAKDKSGRSSRAEALFRQGQTLLEAGKYDAACAKFEASETLENGLGTLLHLGDCYERAGRTSSAWHTFLEAEAVAHDKKDTEREQVAAQRVAALEPRLTRVIFIVPQTSRVPGLTVQLGNNAIPASAWGTIIPVDPGTVQVSVTAQGYRPWHQALDVTKSEGKQRRINVPTLDPVPGMASNARRSNMRTAGIVAGSVGLAGIGAGAVFNALSHGNDANACASGAPNCNPNDANNKKLSNASTVSFALGGALVATGVTLFVLAPAEDQKEKHALRIAARYAHSGGRIQLEGVW